MTPVNPVASRASRAVESAMSTVDAPIGARPGTPTGVPVRHECPEPSVSR